jgi:hypothetical protein
VDSKNLKLIALNNLNIGSTVLITVTQKSCSSKEIRVMLIKVTILLFYHPIHMELDFLLGLAYCSTYWKMRQDETDKVNPQRNMTTVLWRHIQEYGVFTLLPIY